MSRPRWSVFHMMRTRGRIFATSDSICWNPGRFSVVPDMAASSYSFTMRNPWASAQSCASSRCWSMLTSFSSRPIASFVKSRSTISNPAATAADTSMSRRSSVPSGPSSSMTLLSVSSSPTIASSRSSSNSASRASSTVGTGSRPISLNCFGSLLM